MSIEQHWRLAITPLSPVHMGAGADYEPTGYVIDDGALYAFDAVAALRVLPERERGQLNAILGSRPDQDMLRQVQAFFYRNRERLIGVAQGMVRVSPAMEAFYSERVGRVVQHETGGRKVQNKLEIERTAWNPVSGRPILPGSGLKGAMRTALLDRENNGRPIASALKNDRRANQKLQEDLFGGKFQTDPMRMIRVGDAALADGVDAPTEVVFALNRKKQPVTGKNGTLLQSRAEEQGLYQLLESVPPWIPRAFAGALSFQQTAGVESREWPAKRYDAAGLASACNRFYRQRLDEELGILRKRGFLDEAWDRSCSALLEGVMADKLADNRAFLLRVGRHSGAESVTLSGRGVRNIKIMKGKEKPDYLDHSKTVWLAGQERQVQRGLVPFGWLLVEITALDEDQGAWPADDVTAGYVDIQAGWLDGVRDKARRIGEVLRRELQAQQEREAEEQRRVAQERHEAKRREAALQAEMAGLPADAADLVRRIDQERWREDKNALLAGMESYLDAVDAPGPQAVEKLRTVLADAWPGILENPDATQGKKQKPRFKDRPRALAKRVLSL